LELDRPVFI